MVSPLLGRELGALVLGDPVSEGALLPLELSRLVTGIDPIGDIVILGGLCCTAVSNGRLSPAWD